jgi:hypothetical protein
MVESQPSKLLVAGPIPVSRSIFPTMNVRPRALPATLAALMLASAAFPIAVRAQDHEYKAATPERGGIVFTGSSIFQFWTRLTDQMAPLPVLNRAIAGTVTQDMLDRIGQLVLPWQPRIVVYYCGSNEISAGEDAGPIVERTKRFIQILHEKSPNTFFYYTSIHKAPEKRARWGVVEAVNREMGQPQQRAGEPVSAGWTPLPPGLDRLCGVFANRQTDSHPGLGERGRIAKIELTPAHIYSSGLEGCL